MKEIDEFKDLKINISSFADNCKKEIKSRQDIKNNSINFGIGYLDRVFISLMPGDIALFGAKTGQGKTTIITNLALNMANQGKRVSLFALEARDNELEQRIKYDAYRRIYYNDSKRVYTNVRFPEFLLGRLDVAFKKYEEQVEEEMSKIKNLSVLYRTSTDFNLATFEKTFLALENSTDVFIIDHLHYFDIEGNNENKEFTDITKKIRDLALLHGKAVILVAHVRKKTNFMDKSILPSIDDFHGSSNITKIATKAIMMAAYPPGDIPEENKYGVLLHAAKFREDGAATRYQALMWLQKDGTYSEQFQLGKIIENNKTKVQSFEAISEEQKPYWAKGSNEKHY